MHAQRGRLALLVAQPFGDRVLPGKPGFCFTSCPQPPLTCPQWAQLLAAAVTCLGSANRWPWVSGTVRISNVLSSCQTNVLLFSSEIMEHLMHSYKSCQLLQVLSQKGAALERKDGNF